MSSLVPVDHPVESKRKNTFTLGREDPIEPDHKRERLSDNIAGSFLNQAEQDAPAVSGAQQTSLSRADVEKVNGHHREPLDVELGSSAPGVEGQTGPEKVPCSTEALDLLTSSYLPEERQPLPRDLLNVDSVPPVLSPHSGALGAAEVGESSRSPHETLNVHTAVVAKQPFKDETIASQPKAQPGQTHQHLDNIQPDPEDEASVEEIKSADLLPLPGQLFWSNSENLCWLDSILVALVNCKSLKRCRPAVEPQRSPVWRLLRDYEDICCAIQGRQQSARGE